MKKIILILVSLMMAGTLLVANGQQETQYGRGLRDGSGGGSGMGMGRGAGNGAGRSAAAGQNGGNYGLDTRFTDDLTTILTEAEGGDLSAAEAEGLVYMREEEKLARDVYAELYTVWNLPVFQNIAASEQQHMDSIKILLDAYELEDPASDDRKGVFENAELQKLYNDLTSAGRESIVAALEIGATIEDLDIRDLQNEIAASDNDDIRILYQNLMKGSRNHMRSFLRQLDRQGEEYEAQYMEDDYLEKIIRINQETAPITDPEYVF
jgi:hypothetical protein